MMLSLMINLFLITGHNTPVLFNSFSVETEQMTGIKGVFV